MHVYGYTLDGDFLLWQELQHVSLAGGLYNFERNSRSLGKDEPGRLCKALYMR